MNDQCSKCRFVATAGENFYCHRNPPVAVRDGDLVHSMWPPVPKDGWCGDYKPVRRLMFKGHVS